MINPNSEANIADAFLTGFREAIDHRTDTPRTTRQAEQLHPQYSHRQIDAYLNGCGDGTKGDTFRVELLHERGFIA